MDGKMLVRHRGRRVRRRRHHGDRHRDEPRGRAGPRLPGIGLPDRQADPLREGQRRCQEMGEAAANDADCPARLGRNPATASSDGRPRRTPGLPKGR